MDTQDNFLQEAQKEKVKELKLELQELKLINSDLEKYIKELKEAISESESYNNRLRIENFKLNEIVKSYNLEGKDAIELSLKTEINQLKQIQNRLIQKLELNDDLLLMAVNQLKKFEIDCQNLQKQ